MGESSRRSRRRRGSSKRKERRSKPAASPRPQQPVSPPSYSVEENSDGEWVNSRLNVKWPQQVAHYDVIKHRYLEYDKSDGDSTSDRKKQRDSSSNRKKKSDRRSRRKSSSKDNRDKKERKKRDEARRTARSPLSAEGPYISLSGSDREEQKESSKSIRRERKRMTVQTSPQHSKRSHSGFLTDEDGKKIDSVVFDTRSQMMRYKKSDDILPDIRPSAPRRSTRSKKPSAADQRENEEYNRYYVGVRSRRSVEAKLSRPGEFALYYEKPREGEVPLSVDLKIAYLSSSSEPFHFPVECFESSDGHKHYVVMQGKSDGKMFTSILSLVKHYSLYSHVDTATGRLETFSLPH